MRMPCSILIRAVTSDIAVLVGVSAGALAVPLLSSVQWLPRRDGAVSFPWIILTARVLLADAFPLVVTIALAAAIVAAVRFRVYRMRIGVVGLALVAMVPALGALVRAWNNEARLQNAFRGWDSSPATLAFELRDGISTQVGTITVGCLRTAILFATVSILVPRTKMRGVIPGIGPTIGAGIVTIAAFVIRLIVCRRLDQLDVVCILMLSFAVSYRTIGTLEHTGAVLPIIALALSSLSLEFATKLDVIGQLLNPSWIERDPHVWQSRAVLAPKLLDVQTRALLLRSYDFRSFSTALSPAIIILLRLVPNRLNSQTGSRRYLGCFAILILACSVWLGICQPYSCKMSKELEWSAACIAQLGHASGRPLVNNKTPREFAVGPIIEVDTVGLGPRFAKGEDPNDSDSTILNVSQDIPLELVFKGIAGFIGQPSFRQFLNSTTPVVLGKLEKLLALLEALESVRVQEFELGRSLNIKPKPEIYTGDRSWLAVLVQQHRTLTFPVIRTEVGSYFVAYPRIMSEDLESLRANSKGTPGDSILLIWDDGALWSAVTRSMQMLGAHGFQHVTIAKSTPGIEEVFVSSMRTLSRTVHSKTSSGRRAFMASAARNPSIGIGEMELIEGSLIGRGVECFRNGFLGAKECGLSLDFKNLGPSLLLEIRPPRGERVPSAFEIEKETGVLK